MRSSIPWLWIAVLALLLLPTAAGRVLLDVAGGLVLVALALPVVLGGVGWIGWKVLQSRMRTCPACGTVALANSGQCQMCGADLADAKPANSGVRQNSEPSVPASEVTIDISAEDVD